MLFAIPSLSMDGTSPFKTIANLHVWLKSSIEKKQVTLTEGSANFWNETSKTVDLLVKSTAANNKPFRQIEVLPFSFFSFFCITDRMFGNQLIPVFGGAATDKPVIQWIHHVEMICDLCKRTGVELILPLRLQSSTFAMYQQLSKEEKGNLPHIKQVLIAAYSPDLFNAYDQFVAQWLHPEKIMNEYLADLLWLDLLVGDQQIASTFILGLPQHLRLLQVSSQIDTMTVVQLVTWVWAIMSDTEKPERIVVVTQPVCSMPTGSRKS